MIPKLTDLEYVKEVLARSGLLYVEKKATPSTDHVLILGFDEEERQIQGVINV